jgi:hypothetical protein
MQSCKIAHEKSIVWKKQEKKHGPQKYIKCETDTECYSETFSLHITFSHSVLLSTQILYLNLLQFVPKQAV